VHRLLQIKSLFDHTISRPRGRSAVRSLLAAQPLTFSERGFEDWGSAPGFGSRLGPGRSNTLIPRDHMYTIGFSNSQLQLRSVGIRCASCKDAMVCPSDQADGYIAGDFSLLLRSTRQSFSTEVRRNFPSLSAY
jgi:hypothetical protein